jgi:hypothetical protein
MTSVYIKAFVPLMKQTITDKNAWLGAERKFVFIIGSEVRPTSAAKNFEHGIIWWRFEESF